MKIEKVFVATPIGKNRGSEERRHADDMFTLIFNPIEEKFKYEFIREDKQAGIGVVSEEIYSDIKEADVIIADTKDRNPNVFYEIGLAHTLNKPVILLNPEGGEEAFPFDLAHFKQIQYPNDIFKNKFNEGIIGKLQNNITEIFELLKKIDGDKLRNLIPYREICKIPSQDKLEDILSVINDLKEMVPQLLGEKKVITDYIRGENEAFNALTTAVMEARKSVRTTRFSPHTLTGRQDDFFKTIRDKMRDGSLEEFHRIIVTNNDKKESEIEELISINKGHNFNIYLSKHEFDFELGIIDEKIVFIHFNKNKKEGKQSCDEEKEIISSTLKITNPGVAGEFVKIFNNMLENTYHIPCKEIKSLPETLTKVKEKFNDGLKYFNDKKGIIS